MANTKAQFFGADGKLVGCSSEFYLPPYLDWMPIELKAYWFFERGMGEPEAHHVLLISQGEQMLVQIETPLRRLNHKELKEIEDGLEERVREYAARQGISRSPRNQ